MEHTHDDTIHYQHYESYLLRVWRDELGNVRHATLQSTATHEMVRFADLEVLLAFLSAPPPNTSTSGVNE